jgi:hypothetical protein
MWSLTTTGCILIASHKVGTGTMYTMRIQHNSIYSELRIYLHIVQEDKDSDMVDGDISPV